MYITRNAVCVSTWTYNISQQANTCSQQASSNRHKLGDEQKNAIAAVAVAAVVLHIHTYIYIYIYIYIGRVI